MAGAAAHVRGLRAGRGLRGRSAVLRPRHLGAVGDARPRRLSLLAAALLALALAGAGCGDSSSAPEPAHAPTGLEAALASVSATEPLGVGFGWIDVERLRARGRPLAAQLEWAAGALGPGARELAEEAGTVGRSGVDPLEAEALTSTATSYTLALRLDGVDSAPARRAFAARADRSRRVGGWVNFDLGAEWAVSDDPKLVVLGSLAARPATTSGAILLARSTLAREAMERSGLPATDVAEVAAAAGCLGDVLAARLVLNNHTHLPNSGPDLLAFGVSAAPDDLTREVLCLVGDPERVAPAADALEGAFAPDARDGVSGERMGALVAEARVEAYEHSGLSVARAELTRAPGTDPGFLFGAFDRGSTLTYLGLQPPPSPGG